MNEKEPQALSKAHTMLYSEVDWEAFLGRHDMVWRTRPMSWDEGAFVGNGVLGAMIYGEEHRDKRNVLRLVLGRTDVTAQRPDGKEFPVRVPIGELAVELEGWIYQPCDIRLDLWNADVRAEVPTTRGTARLRVFVHAIKPVVTVELGTDEGERGAQIRWYAYPEVDPILKNADGINLNQYIPRTIVERYVEQGVTVGVQSYGDGEGCVTAWRVENSEDGEFRRCMLSVMNGCTLNARESAVRAVKAAFAANPEEWQAAHRRWWHDYYPASFVSIPDTQLEGFYWIQMYKLASAARSDSLPIDNQGPWMTSTPWPGLWFNMNVQMSYSPIYTANRLELGESLLRSLHDNQEQLIRNVPESYRGDSAGLGRSSSYNLDSYVTNEVGNLTWLLHSVWRHYRHSMDEGMLRELLYPLLRRSVCYYLHLLEEGEDGHLHLPPTISPEYGSFKQLTTADSHYDLALLRWGCETLLEVVERLGLSDTLQTKWQDVLQRLVPYPVDETGFRIGKEHRMEFGHRHFSHLLAAFPLHLIGETEEERELIFRSLRYWISQEGDLRGFSFTGAASLAAKLGLGDEAWGYVRTLMHIIKPNTMYKEAGPVIETPLAGAEAIHDMLLQSWGNVIRLFPAVPESWQEAAIHNLSAEGGFLVSAERREGRTAWVHVRSLAGEPCRIAAGFDPSEPLAVSFSGSSAEGGWERLADGTIRLDLANGEEAVLYAGEKLPDQIRVNPVPAQRTLCNYFGAKKPWRMYGLPL
jgi:alpha-L-fucosidase 2